MYALYEKVFLRCKELVLWPPHIPGRWSLTTQTISCLFLFSIAFGCYYCRQRIDSQNTLLAHAPRSKRTTLAATNTVEGEATQSMDHVEIHLGTPIPKRGKAGGGF